MTLQPLRLDLANGSRVILDPILVRDEPGVMVRICPQRTGAAETFVRAYGQPDVQNTPYLPQLFIGTACIQLDTPAQAHAAQQWIAQFAAWAATPEAP